ncbi:MXAN_5187 family protein [Anaeromyxobacter diazotrophicus]|uniref:HAMP domain-containing protein n=1 Tax=Anaeromyxobacter diazotrophicus TaxID=2590199 RepID=A0A7I9VHN6_9BACT|nr:MXAN_5187 family protein [Anaeromyxobacter diazotrophicus]GEJ55904.1 hypothetical protein AMYX_06450 [Anaeromyxobacter diazotrophicus]
MNRLKVLVYVALVIAAGAAGVHLFSQWAAERTLRQLDRDLAAAAGSLQGRAPSLGPDGLAGAETLRGLRRELGADVTSISDGRVVQSTLPPQEAAMVASAGRDAGGRPASAGTLAPQRPIFDLPFPVPPLPLLLVQAPAHRVLTVPSPAGAGLVALSVSTAAALGPVLSGQWLGLATLLLLSLAGLVLVLAVTDEQRTVLPRELVAAADRVARGDFSARAPIMAGRLGTVAAALNRAAEAATAAAAPHPPAATGAAPLSPDQLAELPAPRPRRAPAPPPPTAPEPEPLAALDEPAPEAPAAAGGWPARAAEPAPAELSELSAPEPAPLAAPDPPREEEDATARDFFAAPAGASSLFDAAPPEAPAPVAPAPAAPAPVEPPARTQAWVAGDEDEEHWKATYQDFQRVRAECGEARDGVGYERFREKLQKNRDQLVERYGCRTVRFQVYVKEGKAALKASPVR